MTLKAKTVINSAGLSAQPVARALDGFAPELVPAHHYCKAIITLCRGPGRRLSG